MSRIILILILLLVLGIVGYIVFIGVNGERIAQIAQLPTQPPSQQVQPPGAGTPTLSPEEEERVRREIEQARQRLFEEGVTVRARVERVFPNIGFIASDESNSRLFVHWEGSQPNEGDPVSVVGVLRELPENIDQLRSQPGYTSELDSFLQGQQFFFEAREVTPI